MTERRTDLRIDQELMTPQAMAGYMPRGDTPIVPKRSIAGRALVAVVAIMTFLASLTTGAVVLVRSAAVEWQSDVAREVTIQVRPGQGRDLDAEVARAVEIARAVPGVGEVRAYSKAESAGLLEPWLGSGLSLEELPVPRMIVVKLPSTGVDLAPLRKALSERVAGASLDDHRAWIDRMRTMARTTIAGGIGVLALMLAATVLSVIFATRGAMATNRPIVEVLHFIGAKSALHCRPVSAPFPHAGPGGRIDRRRTCDVAVWRRRHCRPHERGYAGRRPGRNAVRQLRARLGWLPCHPHADIACRGGHRARVAADSQPHLGNG